MITVLFRWHDRESVHMMLKYRPVVGDNVAYDGVLWKIDRIELLLYREHDSPDMEVWLSC